MNKVTVGAKRPSGMVPGKTSRRDLRQRNRRFLLRLLQTEAPISQAELARRSGLGPASVSSILQTLIEDGVLVEEGKTTSGLGRKGSLLAFNRAEVLIVGVLIEQESCEVALVDLSGRVLAREMRSHPTYAQPDEVVALVAEQLEALLIRTGVRPRALAGVGVAVPGLVNAKTGSVEIAANLGWRNVSLRSLFEQRLGLPAGVENIGRAKARAESLWGRGRGHENFVCLEVGSGVGAGVVCDGRVLRGATASAGEVGHISLDPAGPRCSCGLYGCWEVFCSGPAIRRRVANHLNSEPAYHGTLTATSSIQELAAAAEQGDTLAHRVIEETAGYLVRGLVNLICNFDPELIIMSGHVVWNCPALVDAAQAGLRKLTAGRIIDLPLVAQSAEGGVIAASAIVSVRHIEKLASA
jgi:predicted NBD/HSP70 family sugar kinase/biotin operon repressor